MAENNSQLNRDNTMQVTAKEEKVVDIMGAKIDDNTDKVEAEPPQKKTKIIKEGTNAQENEAGDEGKADSKELRQRRSSYKRLGISEDEAEKLLKSDGPSEGRRTRSRSQGSAPEASTRAARKSGTPPAKETKSAAGGRRGRKGKKLVPVASAAEEAVVEGAEEEPKTEKAAEESKEEITIEDEEEEAVKEEDGKVKTPAEVAVEGGKEEKQDANKTAAEPEKKESEKTTEENKDVIDESEAKTE